MDDLISRQAAIDALDGEIEITGRTNAEVVKGYVRLVRDRLERLPSAQPERTEERTETHACDCIERQAAIDELTEYGSENSIYMSVGELKRRIEALQPAQPEIVRCKDCKYWRQQTNYAGTPLSFGFCESDEMWRSLYGETYEVSHIDTDDDFYCGYAERREE